MGVGQGVTLAAGVGWTVGAGDGEGLGGGDDEASGVACGDGRGAIWLLDTYTRAAVA